jgi:hypothetical protein
MYIKDLTEIERAEIRLKLQSWLIDEGFFIYKSSDDEIKKHKIKFEVGVPFKKGGKIIWFTDKTVALLSYHYDTYRFECEAIIVNEPFDLNDYLLILELFGLIQGEVPKSKTEDKINFDKIIPAKIQSILLTLRYTVKKISSDKYFYGITQMESENCAIEFYTNSISIYKKIEDSENKLIGYLKIASLNTIDYFKVFFALGIIDDDELKVVQEIISSSMPLSV